MSVGGAIDRFADEAIVVIEGAANVEALGGADDPAGAGLVADTDEAADAGTAIRDWVLEATIRAVAEGASETSVPDIVIGEPPAAKVWLPIM